MAILWLSLCIAIQAAPFLLALALTFRWFVKSASNADIAVAQTCAYGLFVALAWMMGFLTLLSPALIGEWDVTGSHVYLILGTPWLTKFFGLGGNLTGIMDYYATIQKQATAPGSSLCRVHVLAALGWVLCMPMQFFWTLRHENKLLHRSFGRLGVACSVVTAATALVLPHVPAGKLHYQIGGPDMGSLKDSPDTVPSYWTSTPIALWTIYCACKGFYHAYRREIPQHRIWIVRNLAGGITVAVMRILAVIICQFVFPVNYTGGRILPVFIPIIVASFIISAASLEIYIRYYTKNGEALSHPPENATMGAGRPESCVVFMLLAFFGLALTWYQKLQSEPVVQLLLPSLINPALLVELFVGFYGDVFKNALSAACGLDLFLLAAPMLVFCTMEARRHGLRLLWLHVIAGYFGALAFSLPLFCWRHAVQRLQGTVTTKAGTSSSWCICSMAFTMINFAAVLYVWSADHTTTLSIAVWYFAVPCLLLFQPGASERTATVLPKWAKAALLLYGCAALAASAMGKQAAIDGRPTAILTPAAKSIVWDAIIATATAIYLQLVERKFSVATRLAMATVTLLAPGTGCSLWLVARESSSDDDSLEYKPLAGEQS
jgi:uncharacterized membrane protein